MQISLLNMSRSRLVTGCAVLAGLSFGNSQVALGGWSGQMNGTGLGRAAVNVTSATGNAGSAATGIVSSPSAAMKVTEGFKAGAPLPSGSSLSTSSLVKGLPGYIWQASTYATGGDRTDSLTIQSMFTIVPQPFAFLTMNAFVGPDPNGPGMVLNLNGIATGGTALLLRGFDWPSDVPPTEEDLLDLTPLFSTSVIGQGILDPSLDSPRSSVYSRTIPFPTLTEEQMKHFYLASDGFATSAVPEAGSLGIAFGVTVAGMAAAAARGKRVSKAA